MNATPTTTSALYFTAIQNFDQIRLLGKSIAMSGMFGCQDEHQGIVIAMDCFVRGVPLLEYQSRMHMIMGKPSMKYDAMLADFDALPDCRHSIISKTPELASVAFYQGDKETVFSLSWEDFQKEPTPYAGKEEAIVAALSRGEKPKLKDKYATPRSRATMLFARVVSDAVRSIAPQVSAGRYTPEEIEDMVDGTVVSTSASTSNARIAAAKPEQSSKDSASASTGTSASTATTSSTTALSETTTKLIAESNDSPSRINTSTTPISSDQDAKIRELIKSARDPQLLKRVKEILEAKKLSGIADLTFASAEALIKALEEKQIEKWASDQVQGFKPANPQ
ncbi:MAG: hypothetical protein U0930_05015 [Pirellulales bacterium]